MKTVNQLCHSRVRGIVRGHTVALTMICKHVHASMLTLLLWLNTHVGSVWYTLYGMVIVIIVLLVLMGPCTLDCKLTWFVNQKCRVKAGMAGKPTK
jgi:hypothetical protein